jgi:diguanylate cyclase (GGDEF)-like protein
MPVKKSSCPALVRTTGDDLLTMKIDFNICHEAAKRKDFAKLYDGITVRKADMRVETGILGVLLVVVVVPLGMGAMLVHEGLYAEAEGFLALGFILSIVLAKPIAWGVAHYLMMGEVRSMNTFCEKARNGEYPTSWDLPEQTEGENDLLRLRRNLYWLVRAAANREEWLAARLSRAARSSWEYERLANVDPLTGVSNRRHFELFMQGAVTSGGVIHLLLVDCDGFKAVNDTMGHAAGDELLKRLGAVLSGAVRGPEDCVFRYGGDEFGVVLRGRERDTALAVAERVRARFALEGRGVSLSIGVGEYRVRRRADPDEAARRLHADADAAVYAAKRRGRNRVEAAWTLPGGDEALREMTACGRTAG